MKLGAARAMRPRPGGWCPSTQRPRTTTDFAFSLNGKATARSAGVKGAICSAPTYRRRSGQALAILHATDRREEAFKHFKEISRASHLPSEEERVEAHIFVAFLAYCLHVTLRRWLRFGAWTHPALALEKFAAVQMIDVHLPTTDGRELVLTLATPGRSRNCSFCSSR